MRKALIVMGAALLLSPVPQAQRASAPDAIVPFRIQVSNADLGDLKQRLARARFADSFDEADWNYGTNTAYLKELIAYWRDKYDWRVHERELNTFDQFKTTIDGVEIHFIHQRAASPTARTVLLLNGWPSSIVEYQKVIAPLTNPVASGGRAEDAMNVVIPSMPGFGFSGKPRVKGYDFDRIAGMWVQLMSRLGYTRYFVHGTDFGGLVGPRVALLDSTHVAGLHVAGCGGAAAPAATPGTAAAAQPPAPPAPAPGRNALVKTAHNAGYQEIQSTKPDTLGHAISDSPVGLASWIVEKWYDWADHDGDVEKTFTKDELLTNVMVYWVTNSTASSMRIYYEGRHVNGSFRNNPFPPFEGRVTVPTGCGAFPRQYDRRTVPVNNPAAARQAAETRYNVVHFTTMERGGHFPALEQPALWTADLRAFLNTVR